MIRHFSHIFLTLGRTFIVNLVRGAARLLVAVRDATALQVIWRQLNLNTITGEYADVMHAHLSGNVGQHFVPVFEFDPEHRVRERLDHRPLEDDRVFFWLSQKYPPATMIS
jgi:hypothetical protein